MILTAHGSRGFNSLKNVTHLRDGQADRRTEELGILVSGYMHYMRSKSSHTFILTVVRKVGLGARMNISWPRSYFIYHIIYVHDDVESSTYVNLFISQGKVCV